MMKEGQLSLCYFGHGGCCLFKPQGAATGPLKTAPTQPAGQQEPQAREAGLLQMFFSLLSLLSIAGDVNKGAEVDSSLATD